jgi:hypothetical protein
MHANLNFDSGADLDDFKWIRIRIQPLNKTGSRSESGP